MFGREGGVPFNLIPTLKAHKDIIFLGVERVIFPYLSKDENYDFFF